jgi:hypothetical protein
MYICSMVLVSPSFTHSASSLSPEKSSAEPRKKLPRMSPSTYAAARRSAALRYTDGSAQRTAATTAHLGITDHQTPIPSG